VIAVDCQAPNVFYQDRWQSDFRLFHMARDTSVAGEVDPGAGISRVYFHKMSSNRDGHIPFLGRQGVLSSGSLFERRILEHPELNIPAASKHMPLPTRFQGRGDSSRRASQSTTTNAPAACCSPRAKNLLSATGYKLFFF
jgi:hypothetical protein